MTRGGGASNGLSASDPFDRWYRYPAGFSPSSLKLALDAVHRAGAVDMVIDPFAGTGSVGTAALQRGIEFVGLEAHPEIAELATLKFLRRGRSSALIEAAASIVERASPASASSEHDLVRRCFDRDVLSELVGLRAAILDCEDRTWFKYLKWALLSTLRDVASVKVGWPYQRPALVRTAPHSDPRRRFFQRIQWMAEDLAGAPPCFRSTVIAGDSRESSLWLKALGSDVADASVASPPYLNNFDYADATRIELYFWGIASSWKQMCETVRSGMVIATTQQTRLAYAHNAFQQLQIYPMFRRYLQPLISALAEERAYRRQGKEYDRVIGPYFLGLASVLGNLFEALRPGARCAWLIGDSAPYGIYIDTPALIGFLARDIGFDLVGDLLVRPRGRRWMNSGVRHTVELSERLMTFSRP